jgi:DNA-binding response OmpR family regulator
VRRASDDAQVVEGGAGGDWDVILVASPHGDAVEVCGRLRHGAAIEAGTPIIIIAAAPTTLEHRLAGLRAGAWDVLALPIDAQELMARIDGFVSVKRDADRVHTDGLVDKVSGPLRGPWRRGTGHGNCWRMRYGTISRSLAWCSARNPSRSCRERAMPPRRRGWCNT